MDEEMEIQRELSQSLSLSEAGSTFSSACFQSRHRELFPLWLQTDAPVYHLHSSVMEIDVVSECPSLLSWILRWLGMIGVHSWWLLEWSFIHRLGEVRCSMIPNPYYKERAILKLPIRFSFQYSTLTKSHAGSFCFFFCLFSFKMGWLFTLC